MASSPRSGVRLTAILQVVGLVAGLWFITFQILLLPITPPGVLLQAVLCVATAWLGGLLIAFCVYMVVSLAAMPAVMRFSVRSSAPAMWFAPAIILLSIPSPAAFAVGLVLAANATRVLASLWVRVESPIHLPSTARAPDTLMFRTAGEQAVFLSWEWAWVLMGAFTAQMGAVELMWRHPLTAAACLAASTAILTSLAIVTGAHRPGRPPALPPSAFSIVVTFLLALAFSFGGMAVRRGDWTRSEAASGQTAPSGDATTLVDPGTVPSPEPGPELGGDFPGVILLPEATPHTRLIVPLATPVTFGPSLTRPVGIPFSGEYWMFRPPRTRPPLRSIIRHGRPSSISFHTTDGAPLRMEAHQKIDPPVDIGCCRKIQLAITATDRSPGNVLLELVLIDRETDRSATLGAVPVGSASGQILSFDLPAAANVRKFDEFEVVFHRDILGMDKSAKIAIERFVLV